ncbi:MAG: hypothetical protein GX132_02280 [Erysipelotrichia bacterium]|nr:hypothetical protein [Erysipelotrichia bacterium]
MMKVFETLTKKQKNKNFKSSKEYRFFTKNRLMLDAFPMYRFLSSARRDFDVIRANVIIRSLINKKKIEEAVFLALSTKKTFKEKEGSAFLIKFIREKIVNLPFAVVNNMRVYVPIFNLTINKIYSEDFEKLLVEPYSHLLHKFETLVLDPFENYHFALYESLFTNFIKIYEDELLIALFHYDFQTIYFVNKQGRLQTKIALFDKFIKRPDFHHLLSRLEPVVKAYVNFDKKGLLNALVEQELISSRLIERLRRKEQTFRSFLRHKIE